MSTISRRIARHVTFAGAVALGLSVTLASPAAAAPPTVDLGSAASFAVLAGTEVTNVGLTTISGDVGVSPGTLISGFPPGVITNGNLHVNDGVAADAQAATTTAYLDAANRPPNSAIVGSLLGGKVFTPGVYNGGALDLTGNVTLDGTGDPDAVFIFQAASSLTTAANSTVTLVNANPCNVFWQVTSSAALGSDSDFVGTILALTSITVTAGADINGRLLARNGNVTLISDNITNAACGIAPAATTTTTTGAGPVIVIPSPTTTTTTPTTTTTRTPRTTTTSPAAPTTAATVAFTPPTTVAASSPPGDDAAVPAATPTTVPSGGASTGVVDDGPDADLDGPFAGDLPRTGTGTGLLFVLGVAMIGIGSTFVRYERRC